MKLVRRVAITLSSRSPSPWRVARTGRHSALQQRCESSQLYNVPPEALGHCRGLVGILALENQPNGQYLSQGWIESQDQLQSRRHARTSAENQSAGHSCCYWD